MGLVKSLLTLVSIFLTVYLETEILPLDSCLYACKHVHWGIIFTGPLNVKLTGEKNIEHHSLRTTQGRTKVDHLFSDAKKKIKPTNLRERWENPDVNLALHYLAKQELTTILKRLSWHARPPLLELADFTRHFLDGPILQTFRASSC